MDSSESHISALFTDPTQGLGGDLTNSGTLENSGTLIVKGGEGGGMFDSGGSGGTLDNTGVLINSGAITVSGGRPGFYYYGNSGQGGELVVGIGGVLINSGDIKVTGGSAVRGSSIIRATVRVARSR